MDSRERYIRALRFEGPDRAPLTHRYLPGALRVHGERLEQLYRDHPADDMGFGFGDPRVYGQRLGEPGFDRWGCGWVRYSEDYDGQALVHPLEDWSALEGFRAPEPFDNDEDFVQMDAEIWADKHRHYVSAGAGSLWQRMFFIRGYENILVDIAEGRSEVLVLRDMVTNWLLDRIDVFCQHDIDAIGFGDDWGNQNALMIHPAAWRRIFKPAYRQLVAAAHSRGKLIHFHSDGYIVEIIPDLIEIGFDELNPQVSCMDVEELGRRFAGKVAFRPDIDRQWLLPNGTPEEVGRHIRRLFDLLGTEKGGFACWGEVGPDVPWENAEAMVRTFWGLRYDTVSRQRSRAD